MIQLGDIAKDRITGYEGMVVSMTFYLNGYIRYSIQSRKLDKNGNPPLQEHFDSGQLELVTKDAYDSPNALPAVQVIDLGDEIKNGMVSSASVVIEIDETIANPLTVTAAGGES